MFAIPGIAALVIFILARPQEPFPLLQRVPFLHLFTALAVLGLVVDLRLRRLQPVAAPTLPWAAGFFSWILLGTAVVIPEQLLTRSIEVILLFALYGTIAHGIQRLRTFQLVAGVLAGTCTFIAMICLHQGLSPLQCIGGDEDWTAEEITGVPDGRDCATSADCRGPDAEPGLSYRCERVGMLGTYSIEGRVRYRGELQDPNEIALAISAGALSFLIAFALRKRHSPRRVFLFSLGAVVVLYTVYLTQSRGGLVAALLVPGVYVVRRYGLKAVVPSAAVALPLFLIGGRSGEAAAISTQLRYEAWSSGLDMFHHHPVFGVGARQFDEHFFLTAHNSFVLTLAELGFPGMVMFVAIVYLTFKSLVVGLRELRQLPGTEAATVWGMALLASMGGIVFQINTLSFAYHSVLWIFFGLVGAWCSAVRYHRPGFQVRLTWRDLILLVAACASYALFILPLFLKVKGER